MIDYSFKNKQKNNYFLAKPADRFISCIIDGFLGCLVILCIFGNFLSNFIIANFDSLFHFMYNLSNKAIDGNFIYSIMYQLIYGSICIGCAIVIIIVTAKDIKLKTINIVLLLLIISIYLISGIPSILLKLTLISMEHGWFQSVFSVVTSILPLIMAIYISILYCKNGTSFGKCRMKLIVVNKDTGEKLSLGHMYLRETIGKWISGLIFSLGYIWILIDKDKQGWHDKFVSSIVVKK